MKKLYHIYSDVNNFFHNNKYYDKVNIAWFVVERDAPPYPFEDAITNYSQISDMNKIYPEEFLKELFTEEESKLLMDYLANRNDYSTQSEEMELPVSENSKGCKSILAGGGFGFFILHREEGYNLPFKVEGLFNTNIAEEKIAADDKPTVISKTIKGELEDYIIEKKEEFIE